MTFGLDLNKGLEQRLTKIGYSKNFMIGAWSQWTEEKSNMFANPKYWTFAG